jgi:hypothetical protein
MVPVSTPIVANGATNGFGHSSEVSNQFLDGFSSKLGSAFEGFVEIRDICCVMFAVVDLHRAGINVGFKGRGGVW